MIRAAFTVRTVNGVAYDANHLAILNAPGPDGPDGLGTGTISVLSFVCSGRLVTIPSAEVESIEFYKAVASHCPYCDQSLWMVVGSGIHANPVMPNYPSRSD